MHSPFDREDVVIRDREKLADLVRETLDAKFGGSQKAAAKKFGISQSTISRVLTKIPGQLEPHTVYALEKLVGESIWNALFTEQEHELVEAYLAWLDAMRNRIQVGAGPWRWRAKRGSNSDDELRFEWEEQDSLYDDGSSRNCDRELFRRTIATDPKFSASNNLLMKFEKWLEKHGDGPLRAAIAVASVLDPLLEPPGSGFVERGWPQLTADELRKFISAGICRERILLDRLPHVLKIQEIARATEPDFSARYGKWPKWPKKARDKATLAHPMMAAFSPMHREAIGLWRKKQSIDAKACEAQKRATS